MRLFLRSLGLSFSILALAIVALLYLTIDPAPAIPLAWKPDSQLAKELFKKTAANVQRNQNLELNEAELNHAINSIVNRYLRSNTHITLTEKDTAIGKIAIQLPAGLLSGFINIDFSLQNHVDGLTVTSLTLGRLDVSNQLTDSLIHLLLKHSVLKHYYFLALQHVKSVQIHQQQLEVSYVFNSLAEGFQSLASEQLAAGNVRPEKLSTTPENLVFFQQKLAEVIKHHNPTTRLSIADLLRPLFDVAYRHSAESTAISDNIAIIYVVSAYVNNNEIPFYIPLKESLPAAQIYPVFLYKRTDQAKHFMLSAALTTTGGPHLADILGQEKELRDAFSSSGFSFVDLAADRAGMKFSERATASPKDAKELQRIMAQIQDYSAFMPATQDLPEKLSNAQFTERFDSINSKAYRRLLQTIDDRIEALPIYPKHLQTP